MDQIRCDKCAGATFALCDALFETTKIGITQVVSMTGEAIENGSINGDPAEMLVNINSEQISHIKSNLVFHLGKHGCKLTSSEVDQRLSVTD